MPGRSEGWLLPKEQGAKQDNRVSGSRRLTSLAQSHLPEQGEQGSSGDSGEIPPRVRSLGKVHGDEADPRSSSGD